LAQGIRNGLSKARSFVARQQGPFKVNLVRASIQNFLTSLTTQYQPIYTIALGASALQLGVVNGIGGLAAAGISAPIGWLTGKYGIKRMYLLATPLMALGALLFAISPSWAWIIPAVFVASLSLRMMQTACSMVCGSYLRGEERATGMQLCDTLSSIPRITAPLIAAIVITQFGGLNQDGIRPLYYVQAIGLLAILVLVMTKFEDPLRKSVDKATGFAEGIHDVLKNGTRVKTWTVFIVLSTTSMFLSSTYLSVFAAEVKSADQFVIGGMATASVLLPLALSLPVGRLADTIGRKRVILLLGPLNSLSFVLLILAQGPTWILVSGVFQGFAMLIFVTESAMSAELVPLQLIGSWFGFLGFFRGISAVIGPFLGGVIWDGFGPYHVMFSLIVLEASKFILLLLAIPETLKRN